MTIKKSFLIHIDSLDVLDHLTDEQCGQLLKAFKSYHINEQITLPAILDIAFVPFKNQFKRDLNTYDNVCNRNKINGMKGGRPKNPDNPVGILETQRNPEKPKKPDNDNDNDNDNDSDNKKERAVRFTPPSLEQVKEYCTQKQFNMDAGNFISFYESNGWMVGRNKMKSWKAATRTWNSRNKINGSKHESNNKPTTSTARFMERMRNDWHD